VLITVTCPTCQASGQVPQEAVGHQVTCPVCGTGFLLSKPNSPVEMPDGLGVWVDSHRPPPARPQPAESPAVEPESHRPAESSSVRSALPHEANPPPGPDSVVTAEWLRVEKERFDAYVMGGLARLEQARRENAEAESRHEAACVTRSIELSRQFAGLDARRQDLDFREESLRREKDALAGREEEVARREGELAERAATVTALESRRAGLEAEALDLARLISELRPAVERMELRKAEAEAVRAELAARQSALDRRLIEVGRSELAFQKRLAEFEEMELTVRQELEEREADLEHQRRTLVEEVRALRERVSIATPTPPPRPSLPPRVVQAIGE